MKLESLFTSSRFLFSLALGLIILTGLGLLYTLHSFDQPVALQNSVQQKVPTESDSNVLAAESKVEEKENRETEDKETEPADGTIIDCTDCTLAPVDKEHALPSDFTPTLVASSQNGGGSVTLITKAALSNLFSAASSEGINLEIISAYRSYATQSTTFQSWVSAERANGLQQTPAIEKANTYSAKPGHSEHQLGTVVDLKCQGCTSFDADDNKDAYGFIEKNAHKYGFVVSYPINQENLTGYDHEPWHIRWVGNEIANELFDTDYIEGNGNYSTKLLREKFQTN